MDGTAPVTFGQLSLWRSEEHTPWEHRAEWHLWRFWPIPPGTPPVAVRSAVDSLAARHEALRTVFDVTKELPEQLVSPAAAVPCELIVAADVSAEHAAEIAQRLAAAPFDLTAEYGWRAAMLADTDSQPRYLCVAMHHMTADTYAFNVLKQEFLAAMAGTPVTAPASLQPRELAEQQWSPAWTGRRQAATKYWTALLSRYPAAPRPDATMSFNRPTERIQATLLGPSLGPAIGALAQRHTVSAATVALAVSLRALAAHGVTPDEPILLMASNRFNPAWQTLVTTMNQAAVLDLPTPDTTFGELARAIEWAGRLAYRHGCYDVDEFGRVSIATRGAELSYDWFFNYGAGKDTTDPLMWTEPDAVEVLVGPAPQQTGPRLEMRVVGFDRLRFDLRVDSALIPAGRLSALVSWIGTDIHELMDQP